MNQDTDGTGVRPAVRSIYPQHLDVDKAARAALMGQRPFVVWLTGLSGAGKITNANLVEKRLHGMGRQTYVLDGDNVRHGLNGDLDSPKPTASRTSDALPRWPG